jgi:helix-turn-helix protein
VNQRELDRNAARRLAIIRHAREVTGNVAMTCRYYGISRQVFYTWYRRYETEGPAGLRDRSTRPAHCPHETPSEVIEKIIYLRTSYHFTSTWTAWPGIGFSYRFHLRSARLCRWEAGSRLRSSRLRIRQTPELLIWMSW